MNKMELADSISKLDDDELKEKLTNGYFSDFAMPLAINEANKRNIEILYTADENLDEERFKDKHPILYWLLIGLAMALISKLIKKIVEYNLI